MHQIHREKINQPENDHCHVNSVSPEITHQLVQWKRMEQVFILFISEKKLNGEKAEVARFVQEIPLNFFHINCSQTTIIFT